MRKLFFAKYLSLAAVSAVLLLITGCAKEEVSEKIPVTTAMGEARTDFLKGRDLFEKLKFEESLPYFERAFVLDSNFALAYYYHALANPTTKGFFEDLDKAVSHAGNASGGEKFIIMALQAAANGDQKAQEDNLIKLVNQYPKDERAHGFLGQYYFGQQIYDKAIDQLKQSTELVPNYAPSYNMLGYSYKNMDEYSKAEAAFRKYIELVPNDPNPYDSYAELLMKEGKYKESIEQYKKALSLDPNFLSSSIGISNNLNYLGRHQEARRDLQTLYEKSRNDGQRRAALFAMAVSYADQGNYKDALDAVNKQYQLAKAINDEASIVADLNNMGDILYEQGNSKDAMTKYEESLNTALKSHLSDEVKDNSRRLNLYNAARILLLKQDIPGAKAKAKEFAGKAAGAQNTFQIWLSHELEGLIALQEKDYKKAQKEFNLTNRQSAYTPYYLGLASRGMKDYLSAKKNFKAALEFNSLNNLNQSFARVKAKKALSVI